MTVPLYHTKVQSERGISLGQGQGAKFGLSPISAPFFPHYAGEGERTPGSPHPLAPRPTRREGEPGRGRLPLALGWEQGRLSGVGHTDSGQGLTILPGMSRYIVYPCKDGAGGAGSG
jgi:hypothetical protein